MSGSLVRTRAPIACPPRKLRPVGGLSGKLTKYSPWERSHLPSHETNRFNNGRLDDLLTREDTPGNGVWPLTVCICSQVTALVDCIVRNEGVTFDLCQ